MPSLRAALLALLATLPPLARAECRPAAPELVAEAERKAVDAGRKADQAESVSVRSGNPGAARRATEARAAADAARREADRLACKAAPAAPPPPASTRGS